MPNPRFILHQIHLQCTEKVEKISLEGRTESIVIVGSGAGEEAAAADWSRSSPSKKTGDSSSLTSDTLHDMAAVLDR